MHRIFHARKVTQETLEHTISWCIGEDFRWGCGGKISTMNSTNKKKIPHKIRYRNAYVTIGRHLNRRRRGFDRKTNLLVEVQKWSKRRRRIRASRTTRVSESFLLVKYPSSMEAQCCSLLFPVLEIGCAGRFHVNTSNDSECRTNKKRVSFEFCKFLTRNPSPIYQFLSTFRLNMPRNLINWKLDWINFSLNGNKNIYNMELGRQNFSLSFIYAHQTVIRLGLRSTRFSINTLFLQTYRESVENKQSRSHSPVSSSNYSLFTPLRIESLYFWIILYIDPIHFLFARETRFRVSLAYVNANSKPNTRRTVSRCRRWKRLQWRTCSTSSCWPKARRASDRRLTLHTFTADLWPRQARI